MKFENMFGYSEPHVKDTLKKITMFFKCLIQVVLLPGFTSFTFLSKDTEIEHVSLPDFALVIGYPGSNAEQYAIDYGLNFKIMDPNAYE